LPLFPGDASLDMVVDGIGSPQSRPLRSGGMLFSGHQWHPLNLAADCNLLLNG
jgi:hypothetical protein